MNLSDCTTESDLELLNHSIKKCMKKIQETLKGLTKNSRDCLLCQKKFQINNIHDLVRVYSLVMHCMTYHCTSIERFDVEDFFVVELFLLRFIMKEETNDIKSIILYNNNTNERLYKESLKSQLIALFQTHYSEKRIAFNCEQEIESILYKYYKRLKEYKRTDLMDKPKYLLLILYLRNECARFTRLFKEVEKDNFLYKIGILMNIVDENSKEVERLCKEYEETTTTHPENKSEMEIFLKCINMKYKLGLEEVYDLFEKSPSVALWVNYRVNKHKWEECVRMWATNRRNSSNYVDNSMIDLCVRNMKFEDGWMIYNNSFGLNTSGFSRAIRLCTTALRTTKNTKWRNRLLEVISDVFDNVKTVNLVTILEKMCIDLETLSFPSYLKLISELHKKLIKVDLDDETIHTILSLYYSASIAFNNLDVAKRLCVYSMDFYSKWSKSKKSFCFFIRRSEYDTRIYSNLLGICDNARDCEQFYRVCRGILRNETRINREMCRRLESFHTKNCKDCIYKHRQVVTVKESRGFISHLFE